MSINVSVDSAALQRRLTDAPERINAELRQTLTFAAVDFEGAVIGRTPVGATGHLRQSITHDVSGSGLSMVGRVFSQDQPIKVASVEHGSRPHWAPIGPLLLWASRKLGDPKAAYAIQRAIALRGTRAYGMFNRGYLDALPKVRGRIGAFTRNLGRVL